MPLVTRTDYTDPKHKVPYPLQSHYAIPSRSYLETVPARTLLDGIGINFNVSSAQAPHVAQLLAAKGFKRARVEVGWASLTYADPTVFVASELTKLTTALNALKTNGIRPLILLNANSGKPCPTQKVTLHVTAQGNVNATTLQLDPADIPNIILGRTGLDNSGIAARILITSITVGGLATLSRPLPVLVGVGAKTFTTLKYEPFDPASIGVGGGPFETTVAGWVSYIGVVARKVRDLMGTDADFDLEVWNELTFGAHFLTRDAYYATTLGTGATRGEILNRSIAYLRDPANGVPNVKVRNGFANTVPWPAGSNQPVGQTGIDKHPYATGSGFSGAPVSGSRWINGLYEIAGGTIKATRTNGSATLSNVTVIGGGVKNGMAVTGTGIQAGTTVQSGAASLIVPPPAGIAPVPFTLTLSLPATADGTTNLTLNPAAFNPTYDERFPEHFLTGIQTEHLVNDLGPYESDVGGVTHGRFTAPPGGVPGDYQITEVGLTYSFLGSKTDPNTELTLLRLHAKSVLRFLLAYLNKGMTAVHLYAALDSIPGFGLIHTDFLNAIAADSGTYPGDSLGGAAMDAVGAMTGQLSTATTITAPRNLQLSSWGDYAGNKQWLGNGTAEFPDFFNRDAFMFLPFQVTNSKFAVAYYVATRKVDKPVSGTGPTRFDMPAETFRMTIAGVNGNTVTPTAFDPINNASVPVTVIDRQGTNVTVEVPTTDSPRLLLLDESLPPDLTPPTTTITSGPIGTITSGTVTFTFTSSEPGTFEVRIDGGSWTAPDTSTSTSGTQGYAGLANGSHTFDVRATDVPGNVGVPASRAFTVNVDTTPPDTTITSGPSGTINVATATFRFTSTEPGSTFETQMDALGWEVATSPKTYSGLAQGAHTFQVRATDPAGNVDASPASRAFTVDTLAPQTTINSGPSGNTLNASPSFTYSSIDPSVTFETQLDGGGWVGPVTSPASYANLALGAHTFQVRATDHPAGNVETPGASRSFTVVAAPPPTTAPTVVLPPGVLVQPI